jgi:hypothetical protein
MSQNYEFFLKTDVSSFIGEWIAICDQRIVSHGNDAKKVFEEAKKKCPKVRPLLTKVPEKDTMIF